jgi:MoaA/NifB/PqqE/SkfB family radical SAM enzyme
MNVPWCSAPFVHLHVHTTGDVKTCCAGKEVFGSLKENTIKEIWYNEKFQQIRKDFVKNNKSDLVYQNCATCINFEKNDIHSLRHKMNEEFVPSDNISARPELNLLYIDCRFNNTCNFKCRGCFFEYSSAIAEEENFEESFLFAGKTQNDLVNQLLPYLDNVQEIYFAGGEPLIQEEHWIILDELIKQKKFDVKLRYNTNLSRLSYKKRDVLDYWKHFDFVVVDASIDGWKKGAEYWRFGTKWPKIEKNFLKLREKDNLQLGITGTISWVNFYSFFEFLDYVLKNNLILSENCNFNLLEDPSVYNLQSLPKWKKNELIDYLEAFNQDSIDAVLIEKINGIKNYILDSDLEFDKGQWQNTNKTKDMIRNQDFFKYFPEHENMRGFLNIDYEA